MPGGSGCGNCWGFVDDAVAIATNQAAENVINWTRIIDDRATTKAERPDLNLTVREAAKDLWDKANDTLNDIDLGIVGSDGSDDETYQPDEVEAGATGPGALPPAQGQLDDSCVTGGHASASGSRTNQVWHCASSSSTDKPELRRAYESEVANLDEIESGMRMAGASIEDIARALHAERRAIGVRYKNLTPESLREEIYARNLRKYGDPLGPSIDYLRRRGKSWHNIIESAKRTGGKDLGF